MSKEALFFLHYAEARNGKSLRRVKRELGKDAVCDYWTIIELLRCEKNLRYDLKERGAWSDLAQEIDRDIEETKKLIKAFTEDFSVLCTDGRFLWSEYLIDSISKFVESKEKRINAAKKAISQRWNQRNTDVLESNNERNTTVPESYEHCQYKYKSKLESELEDPKNNCLEIHVELNEILEESVKLIFLQNKVPDDGLDYAKRLVERHLEKHPSERGNQKLIHSHLTTWALKEALQFTASKQRASPKKSTLEKNLELVKKFAEEEPA